MQVLVEGFVLSVGGVKIRRGYAMLGSYEARNQRQNRPRRVGGERERERREKERKEVARIWNTLKSKSNGIITKVR